MKKCLLYGIIAIITMISFTACEFSASKEVKQMAFFPAAVSQCFEQYDYIQACDWTTNQAAYIASTYPQAKITGQRVILENGLWCGYVMFNIPIL